MLRRLQAVQNAAARLVTSTRRYDHITSVYTGQQYDSEWYLSSLFQLVFKALNNLAQSYPSDNCQQLVAPKIRSVPGQNRAHQ